LSSFSFRLFSLSFFFPFPSLHLELQGPQLLLDRQCHNETGSSTGGGAYTPAPSAQSPPRQTLRDNPRHVQPLSGESPTSSKFLLWFSHVSKHIKVQHRTPRFLDYRVLPHSSLHRPLLESCIDTPVCVAHCSRDDFHRCFSFSIQILSGNPLTKNHYSSHILIRFLAFQIMDVPDDHQLPPDDNPPNVANPCRLQ
jgi:hypothetical protein